MAVTLEPQRFKGFSFPDAPSLKTEEASDWKKL